MTAEIAILNKSAVAMAADSAVTVRINDGQKIYNTVNKLFSLSKYHPVGIMIYGNANFMSVPFEVIIKEFRRKIKSDSYSKIIDYGNKFIEFLSEKNQLITSKDQESFFFQNAYMFCGNLVQNINKQVEREIATGKEIFEKDVYLIINEIIKKTSVGLEKQIDLHNVSKNYKDSIRENYKKVIETAISRTFSKLPLKPQDRFELENCIINIFCKDNRKPFVSGIVISGYGEDEIYPSLISFSLFSKTNDLLLYKVEKEESIGSENNASIIPFAQKDMAHTFIEGMHPDFQHFLQGYFNEIFNNFPTEAIKIIEQNALLTPKILHQIQKELVDLSGALKKDYFAETDKYKAEKHIYPIVDSVAFLPIDELALMAETLVNLTLFKQKISVDLAETVGGPIDVAVISKGDGFIWIKRKHYFNPNLNHHFFDNYFNF